MLDVRLGVLSNLRTSAPSVVSCSWTVRSWLNIGGGVVFSWCWERAHASPHVTGDDKLASTPDEVEFDSCS